MNFYQLNFSLSYLFTGSVLLVLTAFIYFKNNKNPVNLTFSIYSFSIAWWSFFSIPMINANTEDAATFWDKICLMGVVFIPTTFLHFTFTFLKTAHKRTKTIRFCYILSTIFFLLNFTPYFIKKTEPIYQLKYFTVAAPGYLIFLTYYSLAVVWGIVLLFKALKKAEEVIYRQQLLYLFWGTLLGYSGGSLNYNLVLKIPPYELVPWGNYLIGIYGIIIAYTIIKYRLMDIRLAITNVGIFFLVYALVLSVPLWLGYKHGLWEQSVWIMLIFSTLGPYIYSYLRKQAENKLLQNQKAYQHTLKQAAYGIGKIKKLDTLLKLVRRTATKSVGISHCSIYLIDDKNEKIDPLFNLTHNHDSLPPSIKIPTPIVDTIKSYTDPFIIEEVLYNKGHKHEEKNMAQFLKALNPEVVIPIVQSDNLLALILLGKKTNNSLYTNDDLTVFSILGNQAGVAIENCLFIEAEKDRLKREGVRARRESLDMMVSTMAHEIDNPLASVVMSADILREEIEDMDKSHLPEYNLELIMRSIKSVIDDSFRVSKIIRAVREYSEGSDGDLNPMLVYEVLDSYRTLFTLIKKDFNGVDYTEEIGENLPPIYAEPILIEEILVNFSKNAFQAVRHNRDGKKVTLRIYEKDNGYLRIEVLDNGNGISPKILKQLYEVPTTTKGSAEGTGIGLYRVRQICGILKAKYGAESEGENQGALLYVEIPVYKGENHEKENIIN